MRPFSPREVSSYIAGSLWEGVLEDGLVGYTGFIGSNLADRMNFSHLFNSSNIAEISGRRFDTLVIAAGRADSHRINAHGDDDCDELELMWRHIAQARARRVVLISTVCVFSPDVCPTEESPGPAAGLTPYGRNRLHIEALSRELFNTTILRLPQLYGDRMKKGALYDLLNEHRVEYIDPAASLQHFDVRLVPSVIERVLQRGIQTLNVVTPPIQNRDLAWRIFGKELGVSEPKELGYSRDVRTRYSSEISEAEAKPYLLTSAEEWQGLAGFVEDYREGRVIRA